MNDDDVIGIDSAQWSYEGLRALAVERIPAPIVFRLRGLDEAEYTVRATITASGARGDCQP